MSNELIKAMARAMDCALAFKVEDDVRAGELTHEERCAVAKSIYAAIADRVVVKVDLADVDELVGRLPSPATAKQRSRNVTQRSWLGCGTVKK